MQSPDKAKAVIAISKMDAGMWAVLRNGEPAKTPAGNNLVLPAEKLAELIAAEIEAGSGKKTPPPMPHSQLAFTALDLVQRDRVAAEQTVQSFATTELLCHRAEHPQELVAEQNKAWQPWLDWASEKYGLNFISTMGLMPVTQPVELAARLRDMLTALTVFELTVLRQVVEVGGSLVLGLALFADALTPEDVVRLSDIDQQYQAKRWGEDPTHGERRKTQLADLQHCGLWFRAIRENKAG